MSIASWKEEFYPTRADEAPHDRTEIEAIQHSITKWTGLKEENLRKHDLYLDGNLQLTGIDDTVKPGLSAIKRQGIIASEHCSLCMKFKNYKGTQEKHCCELCPIYRRLGDTCYKEFGHFTSNALMNPRVATEPMIDLLDRTLLFSIRELHKKV